jgi:asparagine synthase (glutamine-hydrolysing)
MCGIAGYCSDRLSDDRIIERMTGVLTHRGPDAGGHFHDGAVHLGHRRLSIIDLAAGGQPMSNEDGAVWVTYNGEIFNHADLRPDLEKAGHHYKTRCDTETIVHAWEQYGEDCVTRFRGFFAFAVWDRNRQTLFCARDRMGIKPFYYYWDGRLFAFASEMKALLEHPEIGPKFHHEVLPEYLSFGYTCDDRTFFRNIYKLMPGHRLMLRLEGGRPDLHMSRYWDVPDFAGGKSCAGEAHLIQECRTRLEDSIRVRMMSDVPLGMFLSGGLDSSVIAAIMKKLVSGPVMTFSVGYREQAYSELGYARQVADAIGTEHREIVIGRDDYFNALPKLVWHEDEPISFPASVPLYFVSKLASEHVKVVLTGEGSDELFGGYERYQYHLINEKAAAVYGVIPRPVRDRIRGWIGGTRLLSASIRRKALHTAVGREHNLEQLFLDNFYSGFPLEEMRRLLRHPGPDPYQGYMAYWNAPTPARPSTLSRMLYADQKTYLVKLLMKQDQMSMAASIESRVPFLDHPFVEFAARVPDGMKIRGRCSKYILKKAAEGLLPREIIYRKKMGFPTPVRAWLQQPGAAALLAPLRDPRGFIASLVDLAEVERLLQAHQSGHEDGTDRIWRLLNLNIWGELYLNGGRRRYGEDEALLHAG